MTVCAPLPMNWGSPEYWKQVRSRYDTLEEISNRANTLSSGAKALFNGMIAGVGLLLAVELGPIDAPRTLKAVTLNETHILRRELTQYCREGVMLSQRTNPRFAGAPYSKHALDAELELAAYLRHSDLTVRYEYGDTYQGNSISPVSFERVNPDSVRLERLWDCTEEYAKSWSDRYFIPNIKGR